MCPIFFISATALWDSFLGREGPISVKREGNKKKDQTKQRLTMVICK